MDYFMNFNDSSKKNKGESFFIFYLSLHAQIVILETASLEYFGTVRFNDAYVEKNLSKR